MSIKDIIKRAAVGLADFYFKFRGLEFPAYIRDRDRVLLMLFGNENDVGNYLRKNLKSGMHVLDVGANVGLITRICARIVGKNGKIIAFEPDPYTCRYLSHNTRNLSSVEVLPLAISNEDGIVKLHLHPSSGTSNSLVNFDPMAETIDVTCMRLDRFLDERPDIKPNIIKIDVEGAEPRVLQGMVKTLSSYKNITLIIEFCPDNLLNGSYNPHDLIDTIESNGFAWHILNKRGNPEPATDYNALLATTSRQIYCNLVCNKPA